ncbi:hypothetical protein FRB95_011176 [Tulasnella sp. JGI-2019a]|nr:hypothetical protein FRB93_007686 [Tulasnella sp. JGI-2019a]KAG9024689.1 hypothetical protein FRB95_011176 [Tulasnella sp. JGI-2019a]
MKPFTFEELLSSLPLQEPQDAPTANRLRRFFDRYGPSAHDAYRSAALQQG